MDFIKGNLLIISTSIGGMYLLKEIYNSYKSYQKINNCFKQIDLIIENKINKENENESNIEEKALSIYYKSIKKLLDKEYSSFETKRYTLFKHNKLIEYIELSNDYFLNIKHKEQHIFNYIIKKLKLKSLNCSLNSSDIMPNTINKDYYYELDINIPKDLTKEKVKEVIVILFDKTKEYLNKVLLMTNQNDKEMIEPRYSLISEYLALDYIKDKYNISENQFKKAICNYDIVFKIK